MVSADQRRESIDDLDALLESLPPEIVAAVHALPDKLSLIEVVNRLPTLVGRYHEWPP